MKASRARFHGVLLSARAVVIVLVTALAAPAVAAGATACHSTPVGLLCFETADGEIAPHRAYLYPRGGAPAAVADAEHRPGYSGATLGSAAVPDRGVVLVDVESLDWDGDGAAEWRVVRVHAYGPSHMGGSLVLALHDRDSGGTPEHADAWVFTTHHGERSQSVRTLLP